MDWSSINFLSITSNITGIISEVLPEALTVFAIIFAVSFAISIFEILSDTTEKMRDRYWANKLKK